MPAWFRKKWNKDSVAGLMAERLNHVCLIIWSCQVTIMISWYCELVQKKKWDMLLSLHNSVSNCWMCAFGAQHAVVLLSKLILLRISNQWSRGPASSRVCMCSWKNAQTLIFYASVLHEHTHNIYCHGFFSSPCYQHAVTLSLQSLCKL